MKRTIMVITGTRAEYGIIKPVLDGIKKHPDLNLKLLVTGMHLSHEFGYTISEIEEDGYNIDFTVDMLLSNDTKESMVKSLAIGIFEMSSIFKYNTPELVFVCGDRSEPFAATIAASYMSLPVAHLFGGDCAKGSNIDDSIRHSISKFSHIHFTVTGEHTDRLLKLGEEPWRIIQSGSPALDTILNMPLYNSSDLASEIKVDFSRKTAILLQHPTSINWLHSAHEIRITLECLADIGLQTVVLYPNSDPGGREMIDVINEYKDNPNFIIMQNLPYRKYISLLSCSDVLIGNSSSGLFEAISFTIPVINIGIRQAGRLKTANIIDVNHDKDEIKRAIQRVLYDSEFKHNIKKLISPFGDGKASDRIVQTLAELKIDNKLLQKKFAY